MLCSTKRLLATFSSATFESFTADANHEVLSNSFLLSSDSPVSQFNIASMKAVQQLGLDGTGVQLVVHDSLRNDIDAGT